MKIKVELDQNETMEDAEEALEKAVKAKHDHNYDEKFADDILNEFEDYIKKEHQKLIDSIIKEVEGEIRADLKSFVR